MKKILGIFSVIVLVALVYYFFDRPYEFEVNLKAKTLPGDLIETIRIWNRSLENAKIIEVDSFIRLKQDIVWDKTKYSYDWHFVAINDSITMVNIQISEPSRTILNKFLIPFSNQAIEKDAHDIANDFYDILESHLKITKIKLIGEVELDSSFCVCRSLETAQIEKANGMMRDYSILASFITDHELIANGPPMVRIQKWSHSSGLLKFDFCFPIVLIDSLPLSTYIIYKEFEKAKVLKAEYNGNYITSDRAWYELIYYAETKGYKMNGLPIEYFYDNPNTGINEIEWKADIYLPIK
jgi:hypothetical protein